jgi:hypothetical protein
MTNLSCNYDNSVIYIYMGRHKHDFLSFHIENYWCMCDFIPMFQMISSLHNFVHT